VFNLGKGVDKHPAKGMEYFRWVYT